jgi:uncharacterized iron-regulated membrane protein
VTGVANLLLLVLIATGLCLWWPALRWSAIRPVILFRRGLSGRPRDFNWHNVIGVWSAIPLAIIVLGGAMISYPWVGDLVVWLAGAGPAPSMAARPAAAPQRVGPWTPSPDEPSVESMVQTATSRMPEWKALTLTLPNTGLPILVGVIDRADSGRPQDRASIRLDARTGRLLAYEVYEELNRERTVRTFFRYAHTGEILGLAGQTIAGLVSAASVLMVWTGLSLAWRRFAAWRQRSSARRAAQPRAA